MQRMKNTTTLVKAILEQDKRCRNCDSLLYLKVLRIVGDQKGIDIMHMPVPYFLIQMHGTAFPPFESVRRARQKIQEKCPELAASEAVREHRLKNEEAVRAYVLGGEWK